MKEAKKYEISPKNTRVYTNKPLYLVWAVLNAIASEELAQIFLDLI